MMVKVGLEKATRLINHGPLLVVTSLKGERAGITPVAWHMPISKDPPEIVLEISRKHFIYECIMETGDFVANVVPARNAEEVVKCGSCSGRDTDKASSCGFTLQGSTLVRSPSILGALAVLECELIRDDRLMEEYNMVPASVKYAAAEEGAFTDHWHFDRPEHRTLHHLGNRTFCSPEMGIIDLR